MNRVKRRCRARGIMFVEIVVAIVLLGMAATLTAEAIFSYRQSRTTWQARRAALWAAQAQIERLHAGAAADSQPPEDLLPFGMELQTQTAPGQGQWAGLRLVTVTASMTAPNGRLVRESLSSYLPPEEQP